MTKNGLFRWKTIMFSPNYSTFYNTKKTNFNTAVLNVNKLTGL